jgi:hypothetical protein
MDRILTGIIFWATAVVCIAQAPQKLVLDGKLYPFIVDECGDTLIVAALSDVSITSPRTFQNDDDYKKYRRYRRYAADVYPYAVEAVKVFNEVQLATDEMRRGKAKRYARHLYKDLREKFEEPLRKLTKTQGMILIEMVERELNTPVYTVVKDLRGSWTAGYWGTMGRIFGHDIKEGYIPGKDPILDMVLDDFDVTYKGR